MLRVISDDYTLGVDINRYSGTGFLYRNCELKYNFGSTPNCVELINIGFTNFFSYA